jgi:hypothetical protein
LLTGWLKGRGVHNGRFNFGYAQVGQLESAVTECRRAAIPDK